MIPSSQRNPDRAAVYRRNESQRWAVDTASNVYLGDMQTHRVLKLPAGSTTQVELPFTGLQGPAGVAVDAAGNVYITNDEVVGDTSKNRVLKLPAGSATQVELQFTGVTDPSWVAVDTRA
jgi:serine/threonine protein kinase, bacterial